MGDGRTTILTSIAEKTGWRQISGPLFDRQAYRRHAWRSNLGRV
jgi:hypothetical protein